MRLPLPVGSQPVYEARMRGLMPDGPVFVVATDRKMLHIPTVYIDPNTSYDWVWTRGLEVHLIANRTDYRRLATEIGKHSINVEVWVDDVDTDNAVSYSVFPSSRTLLKPRREWEYILVPYPLTEEEMETLGRYIKGATVETCS